MTRIFTGDFSTGDFSQWGQVNNKDARGNRGPVNGGNFYTGYPDYPAKIVALDGDCGYGCRFEVRTGDVPGFGGGERSEVDNGAQFAAVGDTVWVAWSMMFDPAFPNDHQTAGWGVVTQFHDWPDGLSSPVISFGWDSTNTSSAGFWYLSQAPQSSPGVFTIGGAGILNLLALPLDRGNWHDYKMQIKFASDSTGFVKVWVDGAAQTLLTGGTTFTGQTMITTVPGVHLQQGYYRENGITATGAVSYTATRVADSEASL